MVAILACQSCYRGNVDLINRRRALNILGFSSLMSNQQFPRLKRERSNLPTNKLSRFQVEARESGSNGQTIKMVPTSKVMKRKTPSVGNADVTNTQQNGSKVRPIKMVPTGEVMKRKAPSVGNAAVMTGSKGAVNGVSIVNKNPAPQLVKTQKISDSKGLPPVEDLRVLASDEGFSWAIENYSPFQRTIDVWFFVVSLYVRVLFDNTTWMYFRGFTEDKQKHKRRRTSSWLRVRMLQLGPTFIKLGQFASTRTDILPREFVDELAKLQDRVPAFSPKKAKDFIANELGAPLDILFKEFEDWPIAAASLGQVHRAILHNGEKVVVKVQRPGLKKIFDIDLRNIKLIAEYFHRSETFGDLTTDWIGIYEESARILYEEIDYINEGKNADRFRRDFRNVKWVRVPLVIWDYTTTKVLTLEYIPGIKINDLDKINAQGYSRSQISSRAVKAYLIQILRTGFFHADPHPGNLAIDVNESLIYYDFGMMGEIQPFTQERLLNLCFAVYEKDVNKVIRSLIDLGALQPTSDLSSVFLDNLLHQTSDQQQTFSAIGEDLFSVAQDLSFQFPSTVTFVMKAFSTLEGIGYMLDPGFSFVKIAAAFAQELLDLKEIQSGGKQLVQEIGKQADDARRYTVSMPYKIHRIEEFVEQLESGDLKLRVRVLESERAAQKSAILQMATIFTLLGGTLLNLGVTFSNSGTQVIATGSFIGAGVFLVLVIRSMERVKQLDKIKRML